MLSFVNKSSMVATKADNFIMHQFRLKLVLSLLFIKKRSIRNCAILLLMQIILKGYFPTLIALIERRDLQVSVFIYSVKLLILFTDVYTQEG